MYYYYYEIWGGKLLDIYYKWQLEWIQSLDHINSPYCCHLCGSNIFHQGLGGGCCHGWTLPRAFIGKAPDLKTMSNSPAPYFLGSIKTQCFETWGWNLASWGKTNGSKAMNSHMLLGYFMITSYNIHSEHPFTSCWKISHQGCLHLRQRTIQQISCCASAMSFGWI